MRVNGMALQINHIYQSYSAALPWIPIRDALAAGKFPMCDYKVSYVADLRTELSDLLDRKPSEVLFCVYILPPTIDILRKRMKEAWGEVKEARIEEDCKEVESLETYAKQIDFKIISEEGKQEEAAQKIREAYLKSLES